MAPYIASSLRLGSRPSVRTIRSSSSSVSPRARCRGCSTTATFPSTRQTPARVCVNSDANSGWPPVGPTSGSTACSGCGIRPTTFPACVPHTGDAVRAAVGVVDFVDRPVRRAVAEHDLPLPFEASQLLGIAHVLSLAVLHRDVEHLARRQVGRDRRLRGLHPQVDLTAHEPERPVADQRAGQQPALTQDLEAVADPEHRTTAIGERADTVHRRGRTVRSRPVRR